MPPVLRTFSTNVGFHLPNQCTNHTFGTFPNTRSCVDSCNICIAVSVGLSRTQNDRSMLPGSGAVGTRAAGQHLFAVGRISGV